MGDFNRYLIEQFKIVDNKFIPVTEWLRSHPANRRLKHLWIKKFGYLRIQIRFYTSQFKNRYMVKVDNEKLYLSINVVKTFNFRKN
jgi:hypothetical protein